MSGKKGKRPDEEKIELGLEEIMEEGEEAPQLTDTEFDELLLVHSTQEYTPQAEPYKTEEWQVGEGEYVKVKYAEFMIGEAAEMKVLKNIVVVTKSDSLRDRIQKMIGRKLREKYSKDGTDERINVYFVNDLTPAYASIERVEPKRIILDMEVSDEQAIKTFSEIVKGQFPEEIKLLHISQLKKDSPELKRLREEYKGIADVISAESIERILGGY